MWNVKFILTFIFLYSSFVIYSQKYSNKRTVSINFANNDTIILDSLSIVPGSIEFCETSGNLLDTSMFKINYSESMLIKKNGIKNFNRLKLRFQTFPYSFSVINFHRDINKLKEGESKKNSSKTECLFNTSLQAKKRENIFSMGGLEKNGSISRGVFLGNNQNFSIQSDMNLQLSGYLNDEVEVKAVITDNNMPIQPEGNTQQIQDFDKVFIELSKKKTLLIAGDYDLFSSGSHFMKFNKKYKGGYFKTEQDLRHRKNKNLKFQTSAAGAIAKGKFAKNILDAIEGNQGPYRLRGVHNESYIVVLAGSEKVYIDGHLIQRGQENDYTINYNTAEIFFTPKMIVTKDKRIVVEFEYSDKNYARSMFYSENTINNKKWKLHINVYSEQDVKHRPLDLDFSEEHKKLLSNIGDSLHKAVTLYWDTVEYTNSKVLYKLTDSIVGGIYYDSILTYSTNPDSAIYQAGFVFMGQGKGNYIQVKSSANGRVFQWVAPSNGMLKGSHEPVIRIPSPKKEQMLAVVSKYKINSNTDCGIEISFSNNDLNTLSSKNDNNNFGTAMRAFATNKMFFVKNKTNNWTLFSSLSHEFVNKKFEAIERFRNVEYNRNWNLMSLESANENISNLSLVLTDSKVNRLTYKLSLLQKDDGYKALCNKGSTSFSKYNFHFFSKISFLNSKSLQNNSEFFRYTAKIEKKTPVMNLGLQSNGETNRFLIARLDTLLTNSTQFKEWQAFIVNADTAINQFKAKYIFRKDFLPKENQFVQTAKAKTMELIYDIQKNKYTRLNLTAIYRNLILFDTLILQNEAGESFVGRAECNLNKFNKSIIMNTFYEVGTGRDVKKEFSYLEVAAGQGVYKWTDYNSNNVKELNEFDVVFFQDEANYIKVYIPTSDYIKTFYNQLSYNVTLDPSRTWKDKTLLKKIIGKFSDRFYFNTKQKTTSTSMMEAFNPFAKQINDTLLINYNLAVKNSVFFYKRSNKFSVEYTNQLNSLKNLMVNGIESREKKQHQIHFRWNITKEWMLNQRFCEGKKNSFSEFFRTRDYKIDFKTTQTTFTFQPSLYFRVACEFEYGEKLNRISKIKEKVQKKDIGLSFKYSKIAKYTVQAKLNYIMLDYNANENNSLAFEMLEALKAGENIVWDISFQKNLSTHLQLGVRYNGRKLPQINTIHVGSVQLRAFF